MSNRKVSDRKRAEMVKRGGNARARARVRVRVRVIWYDISTQLGLQVQKPVKIAALSLYEVHT